MKDILIKKSKIHGRGAFAARTFKKDEQVTVFNLKKVLTKKEVEKLSVRQKKYVSRYGRKYILLTAPARFINHSFKPNVRPNSTGDIALRDIKKGEELLANYENEGVKVDFI